MVSAWPEITELPQLSADEVHVWAVPLNVQTTAADEFMPLLAPDDRDRAGRFKSAEARRRFTVSHAALHTLLGRYLKTTPQNVSFTYDAQGKPRLLAENASRLNFNLAHSSELALIAVASGCEVGIDIERLRHVHHREEIARRYFHPAEAKRILAVPTKLQRAAFFQCWTRKEAILKALGTGLSHPLSTFQVPLELPAGIWIECPTQSAGESARCYLQPLTLDSEYVAAVACLNATRIARCLTFQF